MGKFGTHPASNNETQEASVALVVRDESMDRQQIAPLTIEEAEYLNKKVSDAAAQYEATVSRELQVDTTEQNIEASFNLKETYLPLSRLNGSFKSSLQNLQGRQCVPQKRRSGKLEQFQPSLIVRKNNIETTNLRRWEGRFEVPNILFYLGLYYV